MSVYKDKRTGHWGYNFMYKGGRYHKVFPEAKTKDEVEGYEQIARAKLRQKAYGIIEKRSYTLLDLINDYNIYKETAYTRPHEFDYVVKRFLKITGNKMADEIILNDFLKYQNIRAKEVKASTANREMDCIKRIFSLAKQNRKIQYNPCDGLEDLRIENPPERFLTKEEELRLLEVANPVMQVMIIVAIYTGMRTNEILSLKWRDVFFNEGYLIALNTKNNKPRKLPIIPKVRKALLSLKRLSEYVFTSPETLTRYKDIKTTFARTVKRAGIPHITFHKLRHTTASRLNELGVDIIVIQRILDHSDLNITRQYTHTFDDSIINAFNKLNEY